MTGKFADAVRELRKVEYPVAALVDLSKLHLVISRRGLITKGALSLTAPKLFGRGSRDSSKTALHGSFSSPRHDSVRSTAASSDLRAAAAARKLPGDQPVVNVVGSVGYYKNRLNVQAWGATGNGVSDDTRAINAASRAANAMGGGAVYFPSPVGTYLMSGSLESFSNVTYCGDGAGSTIRYTGDSAFCTLKAQMQTRFQDIHINLANPHGTGFVLDTAYRNSFRGIVVQGDLLLTTKAAYRGQTGIVLKGNSGDNRFTDCDFNNLGTGVLTETIQNYFVSCVFGTCWHSVAGGDPQGEISAAGLSVSSCTFVGDPRVTQHHIFVNGAANVFWFTECWFEGVESCAQVGTAAGGGPFSFALTNCYMASTKATVSIGSARKPVMTNVWIDTDGDANPRDLEISPDAPFGTAINVQSSRNLPLRGHGGYPAGWTVIG